MKAGVSRPSGPILTYCVGRVMPLRMAYSSPFTVSSSSNSVKRRGTRLTSSDCRKGPRFASSAAHCFCRSAQTSANAVLNDLPVASRTVFCQLKNAMPPWSAMRR